MKSTIHYDVRFNVNLAIAPGTLVRQITVLSPYAAKFLARIMKNRGFTTAKIDMKTRFNHHNLMYINFYNGSLIKKFPVASL